MKDMNDHHKQQPTAAAIKHPIHLIILLFFSTSLAETTIMVMTVFCFKSFTKLNIEGHLFQQKILCDVIFWVCETGCTWLYILFINSNYVSGILQFSIGFFTPSTYRWSGTIDNPEQTKKCQQKKKRKCFDIQNESNKKQISVNHYCSFFYDDWKLRDSTNTPMKNWRVKKMFMWETNKKHWWKMIIINDFRFKWTRKIEKKIKQQQQPWSLNKWYQSIWNVFVISRKLIRRKKT